MSCFVQATMVATWLVELLLDQINRALLEDTPEARAAVDDYTARLRAFLKVLHMISLQTLYLCADELWDCPAGSILLGDSVRRCAGIPVTVPPNARHGSYHAA